MTDADPDLDRLLAEMGRGDADAAARVWELVYEELRGLAGARLAALPPGQTLQSTALVNEAWLKLRGGAASWEGRAHFFGAAARAMRNILVDRARSRQRELRGDARRRVPLTGLDVAELGAEDGLLELDRALAQLEQLDARSAKVVQLRYFAGLTIAEAAEVLGLSHATVEREWSFAKAWLRKALDEGAAS
ncbi:MAG: sigma-70 family RNA polymerase sigma factor [Planctomycetes bacterium]|nr:sigma-70 family RNA polymerase sigma factor [Planctomycetota bacterium]